MDVTAFAGAVTLASGLCLLHTAIRQCSGLLEGLRPAVVISMTLTMASLPAAVELYPERPANVT